MLEAVLKTISECINNSDGMLGKIGHLASIGVDDRRGSMIELIGELDRWDYLDIDKSMGEYEIHSDYCRLWLGKDGVSFITDEKLRYKGVLLECEWNVDEQLFYSRIDTSKSKIQVEKMMSPGSQMSKNICIDSDTLRLGEWYGGLFKFIEKDNHKDYVNRAMTLQGLIQERIDLVKGVDK